MLGATLFSHDREDPLTAGMGGADRPMREAAQQIQKAGEVLNKLVAAGLAPQVAGAVLRYMAAGMPQHLLRMKLWSSEALEAYDAAVYGAWEGLLGLKLGAEPKALAALPLRLGGCACGTVRERADAAFIAGWRRDVWMRAETVGISMPDAVLESMPSTKQLVSRALGNLGQLAPKLVSTPALSFNARPPAGLQKLIVGEVMDNKRQVVYESLSIEQRSEHRKCGGVGSGGFLLVPETGQSPMAAGAWRMALRRRLLYDAAALFIHRSLRRNVSTVGDTVCAGRLWTHRGRCSTLASARSEGMWLKHTMPSETYFGTLQRNVLILAP